MMFICFQSCKNETKYDRLTNYLKTEHQYTLDEQIKAIAVINEKGCISCGRSFSLFMSSQIDNPEVLFLVCSRGSNIDISSYINNQNNTNILLDQHDTFSGVKLIDKPGVIFINQNKIDTIIKIDIDTKDDSFEFINEKLR